MLKGALVAGAGVALGPTLAACGGGGTSPSPTPSATSGGPKKGGHLRVGTVGGSAKETADGQLAGTTIPEVALNIQVYDALMGWSHDYQLEKRLAEEVTPSADASKWTVKLRQGLEFHDGKTVTADDVVFSFLRIIDPKAPKTGAASLALLKSSGIRKVDDLTVEFTLTQPNAVFAEALGYYINCILPVGFDPKKPIGTGPFKLTSFLPGQQIVFAPFPNYYGQVPWVDELTIIEFADTTARVNALLGGTVDVISDLPSAQVPVVQGNASLRVLDAKTGAWQPITMRIDQKPFSDVRVRQAFKLIPDRQAMIEQAYAGFGAIGNDMYSPFDPGYPKDLPQRVQDYAQAKSLLKAAGYDKLAVTLNTSNAVGSGAVAAAQVFAEQAKGAGVTVTVNKLDIGRVLRQAVHELDVRAGLLVHAQLPDPGDLGVDADGAVQRHPLEGRRLAEDRPGSVPHRRRHQAQRAHRRRREDPVRAGRPAHLVLQRPGGRRTPPSLAAWCRTRAEHRCRAGT